MEDQPSSILLCLPEEHALAAAVDEALAAANLSAVRVADVYELTVRLAGSPPGRWRAALLAVDYFNRYEIDFFRLARAERPELLTVALAGPAFVEKALLARAAGAGAVVVRAAQVAEAMKQLAGMSTESTTANAAVVAPTKSTTANAAVVAPVQQAGGLLESDEPDARASAAEEESRDGTPIERPVAELLRFTPARRRPLERSAESAEAGEGSAEAAASQREAADLQVQAAPQRRPPLRLRNPASLAELNQESAPVRPSSAGPADARTEERRKSEESPNFPERLKTEDLLTAEEISALLNGWDEDGDGASAGGRQ